MSDRTLMVLSTLEDIDMSIDMVIERFKAIKTVDDFLSSAARISKN
ncbi:hypothetical protein [Sulfurospirillum sp. hDNRA2]|jgi:hypothetical protein|nr:hypothetical protein [Sulfurospirillum sp. DNRA8]MCP3650872.1 hypothetical protein [Sulfurospirillum sp. DNRA8]MCR1809718.1 hypothetical protein [Sulfurospirillum sp. DNRA8]